MVQYMVYIRLVGSNLYTALVLSPKTIEFLYHVCKVNLRVSNTWQY